MNKELFDDGTISITQFYGGTERGKCLQIIGPAHACKRHGHVEYLQLTEEQARSVMLALSDWLNSL